MLAGQNIGSHAPPYDRTSSQHVIEATTRLRRQGMAAAKLKAPIPRTARIGARECSWINA
jgi:hypothetical protein